MSKKVELKNNIRYVKIPNVSGFDINKTFDCGQCFRFDKVENSTHEIEFSGIAFGKFVSFAQDGKDLYIYNTDHNEYESLWKHYLGLDIDYSLIQKDIVSRSDNPSLKLALDFGDGIRILAQDKWEAVCSFIISQNNNIPRIKKIIETLSKNCGSPVELPTGYEKHLSGLSSLYSFPPPEAVLSLGVEGIFALKTGFRAKYIFDAAKRVVNGTLDLERISNLDNTDEAIKALCEVKGIGPKVASCALLFGFERYDAFPIDVWIKKVIAKYFTNDGGTAFDHTSLGEYAGIAQQYLFYYERYGGYKENT